MLAQERVREHLLTSKFVEPWIFFLSFVVFYYHVSQANIWPCCFMKHFPQIILFCLPVRRYSKQVLETKSIFNSISFTWLVKFDMCNKAKKKSTMCSWSELTLYFSSGVGMWPVVSRCSATICIPVCFPFTNRCADVQNKSVHVSGGVYVCVFANSVCLLLA